MSRVFFSYHSPELEVAESIANALHKRDPSLEVFLAPWTLRPGVYWLPELANAIGEADAFVLLLGAHGLGPWQLLEYYEALDRRATQGRFTLVPVLLSAQAPRLPFLRQLHLFAMPDPTSASALDALYELINGASRGETPQSWQMTNPYRGLSALGAADADFFFGRDALTREIVDRVRAGRRCLWLVGNSGVGKSSIVDAGVIASLRRQRLPNASGQESWPGDLADSRSWLFLSMRPGESPLYNLAWAFVSQWTKITGPERGELAERWAASLRHAQGLRGLIRTARDAFAESYNVAPPRRFVLVIDQGEELYTRSPPEQARRFARIVAQGLSDPQWMVIGSLRSDHYGQLQDDKELFPVTTRVDVPPLAQDALQQVVSEPARLLGARFEDEPMVLKIATSSASQPGALPLLSYLMEDMWKRMQARGDGVLRWSDYPELLGVRGVLAQRADDFFATCGDDARAALKRLFTLKLAHVPLRGEVVRRRARRDECTHSEWALVEALSSEDWRLLVTGEEGGVPIVEVAHEVLLREWSALHQWLLDEHAFLQWKGQLEHDRGAWIDAGRVDDALLLGLKLSQAESWRGKRAQDLAADDVDFIVRSVEKRDRDRDAQQRVRRQRTRALFLGAIAALLFGIFATWQWRQAETARGAAVRAQALADRRASDLDRANVSLDQAAREANRLTVEARRARDRALTNQSRALADWSTQNTAQGNVTLGILLALEALPVNLTRPDRPLVPEALAALSRAVSTHRELRILSLPAHTLTVTDITSDGQLVVGGDSNGTLHLWRSTSGQRVHRYSGHNARVTSVRFSHDGRRIVSTSIDGTARVWGVDTGQSLSVLRGHEDSVMSAEFSADDTRVVTVSADTTARVWDLNAPEVPIVLSGHSKRLSFGQFSRDGRRVVTSSWDGTARIWDLATGEVSAVCKVPSDTVYHAEFSPNGGRLVTASDDAKARIWDATSGELLEVLEGHRKGIPHAVYSDDGRHIATASWDGSARIWDAQTGRIIRQLRGHRDAVLRVRFSHSGARLLTVSEDGTARIWDARSGEELAVLRGHTGRVLNLTINEAGDRVVSASDDGTARVWDTGNIGTQLVLSGHEGGVSFGRYVANGARALTLADNGEARLWALSEGRTMARFDSTGDAVVQVQTGGRGARHIVTRDAAGGIKLWQAQSGSLELRLAEQASLVTIDASGTRLAVASDDGTLRILGTANGSPQLVLPGQGVAVCCLDFNTESTALAAGYADGSLAIWDTQNGDPLAQLRAHEDAILVIRFDAAGKRVLSVSRDGTARLWNIESRELVSMMTAAGGAITHAEFSADGSQIVTAAVDGSAQLWQSGQDTPRLVLIGHGKAVAHVAFSADGQRLVTASEDRSATVWETRHGTAIAILKGHRAALRDAAFSPDASHVITSSLDRTSRIWALPRDGQSLLDSARCLLPRQLTEQERRRYFVDAPSARSQCTQR